MRIGEINNESHSVVKECIEKKSVQIQNNDDSLFLDYTAVLNNLVINNSKGKQELVTDDNALRALYYLSQCSIEKPGDILLLCASANLLNKYRSQNDALINDDKFKNFLCEMLTAICSLKINNINFSIDYSNEKNNDFLIIQSGNIQFSFYGSFSELDNLNLTEYRKNLKWDEIRKKPLANTLFSMVKSNILLLSNKTKDNKNMLESCEILINQYLNNTIKAKDIINPKLLMRRY